MRQTDYLHQILKQKQSEVEALVKKVQENPNHPLNQVKKQLKQKSGKFSQALRGPSLAVIGEVKRRSPSRGSLHLIPDPTSLALNYCKGGVSAISVLTDVLHFGGSLDDLLEVSKKITNHFPHVALLRKDFIIHPIQLAEAVLAGADAVLLIVAAVGKHLKFLMEEAEAFGLEVLTEVHDMSDLEIALESKASIVGINHRNLSTFEIDLKLSESLRSYLPASTITVAESGIHTPEQAQHIRTLGFDAILVGEALVTSRHPSKLIQQMRGEKNGDEN